MLHEFWISLGILNLGKQLLCSTFSGFLLLGCPLQYLLTVLLVVCTILMFKIGNFSVAFAWQGCAFEIHVKSEEFLAIYSSEMG